MNWTPERDAALGTEVDEQIAARIGCSRQAVALRRRKLGVPPFRLHVRPRRRWTQHELAALDGEESDERLAARLARTVAAVRSKRRQLGRGVN